MYLLVLLKFHTLYSLVLQWPSFSIWDLPIVWSECLWKKKSTRDPLFKLKLSISYSKAIFRL